MDEAVIVQAWKGRKTDVIPLWLMRQAGRYLPEYRALRAKAGGFLDMVYNPGLAAEITLQPLRRFDLDAAILFSDILVVPHALGQDLRFAEGEGPVLGDLDIGKLDEGRVAGFLAPVIETVAKVRDGLPRGKALIGFAGSPWTVASYMVEGRGGHDFSRIRGMEAGKLQILIDILVRSSVAYLDAQIRAGAQAVQLFESWAGALGGADFERWVIAPNRAIVSALKTQHPDVPVIGFPRTDNREDVVRYAHETGVDAVGLSQGIEPAWAAKAIQNQVCVQGNLDPALLLAGGDTMTAGARAVCDKLGGGPFVFNLGHGVDKMTNPDHVSQLVETIHGFKGNAA
ncbi:MAG: uroporphyrinogen decarboxylase [Rhodospirillales bacterium]|nr:uroporphyrinogen decarboxylase [Alphaproteobacteria bacterium]MCB9986610.1 uroporphyrinogen decarboxylase [Rhodospirillales bacterium]USO06860.1 MAG: uroporphyrinogen decarboxylase [Rhodospirillales bacterium]